MKTTNRFAYLVTAVTTAFVFCMFVTACGSDDKSELEDLEEDMNDGVTVTKGLHQLDVSFDGDTSDWDLDIHFYSVDMQSNYEPIYENDKLLEYNYGYNTQWKSTEFRSYSITTDKKAYTLDCWIGLTKKKNAANKNPMAIKVTSKINNRIKYEKEFVINANNSDVYIVLNTNKVFVESIE